MKKVCLSNKKAEDIKFLINGQRHGEKANEITIDAAGVVVQDEHAEMLEDRLGMQVTITDVVAKDVAKEAAEAAKAAEKAEKEAEKKQKEEEKKAKEEADAKAKADAEAAKNK